MPLLRKVGSIFVFDCMFHERILAKDAGLWFHGDDGECNRPHCDPCRFGVFKKWWTFDHEKAQKLAEYAAPKAKLVLERMANLDVASRYAEDFFGLEREK